MMFREGAAALAPGSSRSSLPRRRHRSVVELLAGELDQEASRLARRFASLNFADGQDLVLGALVALHDDPRLPARLPDARRYLRRVAERDAHDELRRRHGRPAALRRPAASRAVHADKPHAHLFACFRATVDRSRDVSEFEHVSDPAWPPDGDLGADPHVVAVVRDTRAALERVPPGDAHILILRYVRGLEPAEVARQLGISDAAYESRLKRATKRLRDALPEAASLPQCASTRALLAAAPDGLLGRDDAARRDAHLIECVACRAFERKLRGALLLLPGPAAMPLAGQSWQRLGGWFHRSGEAAAGVRDAPELALAGGASGLGLGAASSGLTVKAIAVCTSAAVGFACLPGSVLRDERPVKPAVRTIVKPVVERKSTERPEPVVAARTSPVPAHAGESRPTARAATAVPPAKRTRRSTPARVQRARAAAPEFSLEAGAEPQLTAQRPSSGSGASRAASTPTASAPRSAQKPSTPSGSTFGGEFSP